MKGNPRELLLEAFEHFRKNIKSSYYGMSDPIEDMMQNVDHNTVIDLRGYVYPEISPISKGYDLLAENLRHTEIEALYLPNAVNFEKISALVNSFRENNKLTKFGFGDDIEFTVENTDHIIHYWKKINELIEVLPETKIENLSLDLTSSHYTPEMLRSSLGIINDNQKLTELGLRIPSKFSNKDESEIGWMPAATLFEMIANNQNLKNLNLSLKQEEVERKEEEKNFRRISLSLKKKCIKTEWPREILQSIHESLVQNQNLESITIEGRDIDDNFAEMLLGVVGNREKLLDVKFGDNVSTTSQKIEELDRAIARKKPSTSPESYSGNGIKAASLREEGGISRR